MVTLLKKHADFFIRGPVGFHLIYGSQDNVFSIERMQEFADFLASYQVVFPLVAAHISVYAQLICGILFILGKQIKWAALVMIINFIVAIGLVHLSDSYPQKFPAIMMLCSSIFLFLNSWRNPAAKQEMHV